MRSGNRRAEQRLAFILVAPAALLMLAVTAYPIGYAVWLSLQRNNLATPDETAFIGLENYRTVLTDRYWWTALTVTLAITVVSVTLEFVLGLALALVMHRTLIGKGLVRTAVLIPYGIVTVVASYSWYYAWTPGTGYLANLLPHGSAPLTQQVPSLGVVVIAEVWKTTPFMSLLLLAGLALVPEDLLKAAQVDGPGLAAVDQGHPADHQAGGGGGTVVSDSGCLPHFRQHLCADRWREQHRVGVNPGLRQPVQGFQRRSRLSDQRADLRLRGHHRADVHQAVRRCSSRE
ncbi:sugar ABC superfamily ATP binding cassette transporter, permease protein [Mycobacterium kansasii 824]|nr:sugar ABC superfamily ATP binding cassette transporter, permease protein [Mycobacterium kansasii 824]